MIARRGLLGGAAAGLALRSPAALGAGGEALTVVSPGGFGIDFMEVMNAVAGGHLAREGFDATLIGAQGQATAAAQVIAGHAAFTRSAAIDLFLAAGQGPPPLVSVATLYQASTFHVISAADKPLPDAASLDGKTIGVVSVRGSTELLLDLMLHEAGIARERVARVAVGNSPGALALVGQGRIDGFIASVSVVAALAARRAEVVVWSTDRYAPMPGQCWVTTPALLARSPDGVTRFLRALTASCAEVLDTPFGPVLARITAAYDVPGARDPAALIAVRDAIMPLWLAQGRPSLLRNVPALWDAGARAVRAAQVAPVGYVGAFYTNAPLAAALKG